jgi:hypothetical protein
MEKKYSNICNMDKNGFDGSGFLFGIFLSLWGVSELLGDAFWWASAEFMWPAFLIGSGALITMDVMKKALIEETQ